MQNEYLKQVIRRNANHASPDPSDPQVDSWTALDSAASRTSKASHSTMPAKRRAKRIPEPQLRMNSNNVDRIVMAISSLNFTMKEARESDQKSRENERNTRESELKILKELHDSNKTQAAEARKREDAILNGIEQMGTNIAKAINSEITAFSNHANVLNEAALDAIMKQLHAMNHTKETPKSPETNYSTTTSEDPQPSQPKKDESPEDREPRKQSPATPSPPERKGPKRPSFPLPRASGGPPYRPDPGGSGGGGGGGGGRRRLPNNDDPDESPDPDDLREQKTTQTRKGRVKAPPSTPPAHP